MYKRQISFHSGQFHGLCFSNLITGAVARPSREQSRNQSWQLTLVGFFLALLLAGAQAVWLLGTGRAKRGEGAHMPFGPALCAGFWLALLWGKPLLDWYLGFFP